MPEENKRIIKQHEVDDLRNKLNWFLKFYGKHFADAEKDETGDAR